MKFHKFTKVSFHNFYSTKDSKENYKKPVMVAHGKKQIKIQVMKLERWLSC